MHGCAGGRSDVALGSASGAAGPCGWGRGGEERAQESGYNPQWRRNSRGEEEERQIKANLPPSLQEPRLLKKGTCPLAC